MSAWDGRCQAAQLADPRPCQGPTEAVQIVDQTNVSTPACLLHGSVLLASLERGRVYPLNGADNSAIVKGQDEVLSCGLESSWWADSRIPCWWPGDLRVGLGQGFHPLAGEGLLETVRIALSRDQVGVVQ